MASFGPVGAGAQQTRPARYSFEVPGGPTAGTRVVALSFDDGPGPYTPQVLSVLQRYGVPATFFELGRNVAAYPQYARAAVAAGDPVENHTWSHADLTDISTFQLSQEIDRTQAEIASAVGATPTCVRPPGGRWDASVLAQLGDRGLTAVTWSVDPVDWTNPGVDSIVTATVDGVTPGAVVLLHDGGGDRAQTVAALPQIITTLRTEGYSFVPLCGSRRAAAYVATVRSFGDAPAAGPSVRSGAPLVGTAVSGSGYWLVAADGGVFSFGDAVLYGSMGGRRLVAPVVGMAATTTGRGYWLVAADGGVFSFGDAAFYGSMGGRRLVAPVVGMAATTTGRGYWLVAADGGVFSFGDAAFYGSMGGRRLVAPVMGMAARATGGYWLVAADGGVFSFAAPFEGSTAGLGADVFIGMAPSASGAGYLLAGQQPG